MHDSMFPTTVPDDIAIARDHGARAFQMQMLGDPHSSDRCCCFATPVYREAFHFGFYKRALEAYHDLVEERCH